MNIQNDIIYLVFAVAVFYIGKKIWKMFQAKKTHESCGCGKCDASEKIISDRK